MTIPLLLTKPQPRIGFIIACFKDEGTLQEWGEILILLKINGVSIKATYEKKIEAMDQ